jgi:hypothetical protein
MSKRDLKKSVYLFSYGAKIDRRKLKRVLRITAANYALFGNFWGDI